MRLLTVDGHWKVRREDRGLRRPRERWRHLDVEAGLVIETPGRWLRLFAVWGEAPGSHMFGRHRAAWRTDLGSGQVHGWNVRAGWWPGPCLTMLAHTRTARPRGPHPDLVIRDDPMPWDDPEVMAADVRQAIRDIEASGGPHGVFAGWEMPPPPWPPPLTPRDEAARMALWGPCEACGAARDIRLAASPGIPGRPGSGGVYDEIYCPACGWPGERR